MPSSSSPPVKRSKQYLQQRAANDSGQQQQHRHHYDNFDSVVHQTAQSVRGRGRPSRRRGSRGTRIGRNVVSTDRILRKPNDLMTTSTPGASVSGWRQETTATTTGGRRTSARGRRRASRIVMAGRNIKEDSASVVSGTRRGGRPPRNSSTVTATSSTAGRPKRPWEGSEDEEDELSKRYGFGRSFLFSEEEDEEDEADEGMGSDQTDFDTDDDSKMHAAIRPLSSSPSPFLQNGDEDDLMAEEEEFLAQLSPDQIPPLVLGDSSVDLLIYKEHLMDTLEVYEVLLNYGSILQLSPFLFEDFCAAIRSPKQSRLLCEIHLAFLRLFFREEDSEHTIFAATETTVSVNILMHLMDSLSFAEVLRHYMESDPNFPADVLHILQCTNYPFVELDKRLRVLKWMCERFFQFDLVKRIVGGTHKIKHDEQCRSCGKVGGGFGKLLACAECEAVYHVHCDVDIVPAPPPAQPSINAEPSANANNGDAAANTTTATSAPAAVPSSSSSVDDPNWRCPLCRIYVAGITDENCLLPGQISHRNLSRITSIGKDRHDRLYWFMVRRIFVQDSQSGELYYYSTLPQLFDLINHLDPVRFERRLCRRLSDLLPSVAMQMHATLELTDQRWRQRCAAAKVPEQCPSRPYLHSDNVHRMSRILGTVHMEVENNNTLSYTEKQQHQKQHQFGADNAVNNNNDIDNSMNVMDTVMMIDEKNVAGSQHQQQKTMEIDDAIDKACEDDVGADNSGDAVSSTAAAVALTGAVQNGAAHHHAIGIIGDNEDNNNNNTTSNNNNENDNDDEEGEGEGDEGKRIDVTTSTNDGDSITNNMNNNNNQRNNNELLQMVKTLLCIKDGHLVATFWSAGMSEMQLLDYCSYFVDIKPPPEELLAQEGVPPPGARTADDFWWWRSVPQEVDLLDELNRRLNRGFRLGFSDGAYLQYVNHYSVNPDLCRSAAARKMERDKRKYMASRFSITDQGEFTWHLPKGRLDHYGTAEDMLRCVQLNLRRLVDRIPDALMHRRWVLDGEKSNFLRRLSTVTDIDSLRNLLMLYEAAMRRPVFLPIWWQSLAATRFIRITSEWRERRQLLDNARKKEEKALQQAAESDVASSAAVGIVWVHFSLFGGVPPRHQLWRTMKDEQYRLNGLGALGGWLWVSSTRVRRTSATPIVVAPNLATRKVNRLEGIARRLLRWRLSEEKDIDDTFGSAAATASQPLHCPSTIASSSTSSSPDLPSSSASMPYCCYSTNCRMLTNTTATDNVDSEFGHLNETDWPCYSPSCTRRTLPMNPHRTRGIVKAKLDIKKQKMTPTTNDGVFGEQLAFPFPTPHDFKSGAEKRSILKLPKWFLKRLARQGGMNPSYSLHFFHQTAKSNPTVWPYPCVRPLFFYCWRYLTSGAQSIHALALRFRILYACIRWADMAPDPDDEDPRVWSHQADYDEVRMVVSHKENPPDGYYEQYLLKVDQYMVEDDGEDERDAIFGGDDDDSATYRQPSVRETDYGGVGTGRGRRGGRRRRQRGGGGTEYRGVVSDEYSRTAIRQQRQRVSTAAAQQWRPPPRRVRTLTRWIDGVDLKLYEISWYWSDWLRNTMADAARAREEQRRRKALDAASTMTVKKQHQPQQFHHQHHSPHQQQPVQVQYQQHYQPPLVVQQHHHHQAAQSQQQYIFQPQQQQSHQQQQQYHYQRQSPQYYQLQQQQQLPYQQQPQQHQLQQQFVVDHQQQQPPQQRTTTYKVYYVPQR